ncbi:hypothetical protein LEP1GSC193_2948 [Leptospira alstonii serovar Pingchang str. 80-412]|uniref:Uncharacterized protein n=2 Tax=Leptospira alstonii TaxID=28452 RepID=M6D758_9LEPT|nr:hypothetical protein LEP1GSC194_3975 [Leptospira alstonii serovar Sichuan str. 79601]EQA81628.1 hypothetical protein LEP1GSC193_2948 [Leptospira alstonii serovar Pingchang str. 80-412]
MIFLSFPDIQSISDLYPENEPKFIGFVRLIGQFSSRFQEFKINWEFPRFRRRGSQFVVGTPTFLVASE